MTVTNQALGLMNYEFWEVRAEMTTQNPTSHDLAITLLECESEKVFSYLLYYSFLLSF